MSERQKTQAADRRGDFDSLGWLAVVLLVLYPLSAGPAMKLVEYNVISERPVGYVYAPLTWLARNCPPVQDFLDWYLGTVWRIVFS